MFLNFNFMLMIIKANLAECSFERGSRGSAAFPTCSPRCLAT
jgi:hypothetical protein